MEAAGWVIKSMKSRVARPSLQADSGEMMNDKQWITVTY